MRKCDVAPALRDAIQRCGGLPPADGFYELLERVNRTVRALEQEAETTRTWTVDAGGGARGEAILPKDQDAYLAVAHALRDALPARPVPPPARPPRSAIERGLAGLAAWAGQKARRPEDAPSAAAAAGADQEPRMIQ